MAGRKFERQREVEGVAEGKGQGAGKRVSYLRPIV